MVFKLLCCILVLLSLSAGARGDDASCKILKENARSNVGFSGCKESDDNARGCFVTSLDVLYKSDNGTIEHEVLNPESYISRVKSGGLSDVVSVTAAAMKCPEIIPCFPLTAQTLVRTQGNQIQPRKLSELQLNDEVVVSIAPQLETSRIVNFAHRSATDKEPVRYVRIHTAKGTVVLGSPDHNLFVAQTQPYYPHDGGQQGGGGPSIKNRVSMTFGKLARDYQLAMKNNEESGGGLEESSDEFFLFTQSSKDHAKIVSVDIVVLPVGFVAPITESGTMLLRYIDPETNDGRQQQHSLDDDCENNDDDDDDDDEWIEVSCFSTLPDNVARLGHDLRMLPTYLFGVAANSNEAGVGGGYWMDTVAYLATLVSYYMMDHIVELLPSSSSSVVVVTDNDEYAILTLPRA